MVHSDSRCPIKDSKFSSVFFFFRMVSAWLVQHTDCTHTNLQCFRVTRLCNVHRQNRTQRHGNKTIRPVGKFSLPRNADELGENTTSNLHCELFSLFYFIVLVSLTKLDSHQLDFQHKTAESYAEDLTALFHQVIHHCVASRLFLNVMSCLKIKYWYNKKC